jgi:hypothetical protein
MEGEILGSHDECEGDYLLIYRTVLSWLKAASISETSVSFYQTTWRKFPEDNQLHTSRRGDVICLSLSTTISFSRRALLRGVSPLFM